MEVHRDLIFSLDQMKNLKHLVSYSLKHPSSLLFIL